MVTLAMVEKNPDGNVRIKLNSKILTWLYNHLKKARV
jgi:hypothetical protein